MRSSIRKFRTLLYLVFIAAAILSIYFSFQEVTHSTYKDGSRDQSTSVSVATDSAFDGGAAGFATLSGLALVAIAITYLKNEEN